MFLITNLNRQTGSGFSIEKMIQKRLQIQAINQPISTTTNVPTSQSATNRYCTPGN